MLDRLQQDAAALDVIEGDSSAILDSIHRPGCAAAIWQRSLPPLFQTWLDGLAPQALPTLRCSVDVTEIRALVQNACGSGSAVSGPALLAEDVSRLARLFARCLGKERLNIRLDAVRGNACRRFHVDYVPARLLCTYRGAATQYGVPVRDGAPLAPEQMRTGAVGIFRGRNWTGDLPCGLVHRSPPIEGSGETRLLLVIDPATGGH